MNSAAPIQCTVRPSALLAAFLFLGHGFAFVSVLVAALPALPALGLLIMLGLSLGHSLWRVWKPEVRALIAGGDGRLQVELVRRGAQEVEVSEQTLVLSWLIVLRYRLVGEHRSRTVVFLPGGLVGVDTHRLLRRWLRWKSSGAVKVPRVVKESGPVAGL